MSRRRPSGAPKVVHRSARVAIRATAAQRERLFRLLVAGGDVWAWALSSNEERRARDLPEVVTYKELCRELARLGRAPFGEVSSAAARSVLRRYSDAWFTAAKAHRRDDWSVHYPRRRRHLFPLRFCCGTFDLDGRRVRLSVTKGAPPLLIRLSREVPYQPEQVRSVTLLVENGRLVIDVTAEVEVQCHDLERDRVAGVDLGVIHPFALAGPDRQGLLVSGRALRAESRLHLAERKSRSRATSRRAPAKGQSGSRRWRKFQHRTRTLEARHRHRLAQARHEAAREVIDWAVEHRVGTLVVGDPVGVLDLSSGPVHNQRVRDWRPGQLKNVLGDKAELAGIEVFFVDERGTSSTCPDCDARTSKPRGRKFRCASCHLVGHRDLVGAVNIAARNPRGGVRVSLPDTCVHRRAGRHLPGAGRSRRDPRRVRWDNHRALHGPWPAVARPEEGSSKGSSSSTTTVLEDQLPLPNAAKVA